MPSESNKILIVDDETQIRRVLRAALSAHGYRVRAAADGISAIETFNDWKPDLIITDLQMPEMNGHELVRSVRLVSNIPIILLPLKAMKGQKSPPLTPVRTTT